MKKLLLLAFSLVVLSCGKPPVQETKTSDPLPSWNEGTLKSDIVAFVTKVTKEGTPDFIPVADRIATFDNDGTLWAEKPYVQELFIGFRVKEMVAKNPALAKQQPFKVLIDHDKDYLTKGGAKLMVEILVATNTGMAEEEYESQVKTFFETASYPGKNVSIKQIRYQPQLELLNYLRANGFKVYICTGGTVEFVRAISDEFYGVPAEQVIGSSFKYVYADSSKKIYRQPALNHFNDQEGKPVSIQIIIGKKPVIACGNEGGKGDIAMLSYSQTSKYPSLQLLVNHDDEAREYLYSESDSASLTAAAKNKWHVISIKNDWKEVFAK